jgi:hypothetical protein
MPKGIKGSGLNNMAGTTAPGAATAPTGRVATRGALGAKGTSAPRMARATGTNTSAIEGGLINVQSRADDRGKVHAAGVRFSTL